MQQSQKVYHDEPKDDKPQKKNETFRSRGDM